MTRPLTLGAFLLLLTGCGGMGEKLNPRTWFSRDTTVSSARSGLPASPTPMADELSDESRGEIQLAIAESFEQQGDLTRAAAAYEAALASPANAPRALHRLGVINDQLDQPQRADQYYQRAAQHPAVRLAALNDHGYSKYLRGEIGTAERLLIEALGIDPGFQPAHANLAMVRVRQSRLHEAVQEFALAGCNEAECRTNLAFALATQGELQRARAEYEHALRLEPRREEAVSGLRQLDSALEKAGGAMLASGPIAGPAGPGQPQDPAAQIIAAHGGPGAPAFGGPSDARPIAHLQPAPRAWPGHVVPAQPAPWTPPIPVRIATPAAAQ